MSKKDTLVVLGASYDSVSDAEVDYESVKQLYSAAGVGHDFDAAIVQRGADGLGKPLNCTATTLAKIAETRPGTLEDLERVQGMGPQKAERFGAAFLAILQAPTEA